jgi:hypothetical protein
MARLFDGEAVTVTSFVDSGVDAFASAGGDSFEDFGDRIRLRPGSDFRGKSCLVGDLAADDVEGS